MKIIEDEMTEQEIDKIYNQIKYQAWINKDGNREKRKQYMKQYRAKKREKEKKTVIPETTKICG